MITKNFYLDAALRVLHCTPNTQDNVRKFCSSNKQSDSNKFIFLLNEYFNLLDKNFKDLSKYPNVEFIEIYINQVTKDDPLFPTFKNYFNFLLQYLEDNQIIPFIQYDNLPETINKRFLRGYCHISQLSENQIAFFLYRGVHWYIYTNDLFMDIDFLEIDQKKTIILFETNNQLSYWRNLKNSNISDISLNTSQYDFPNSKIKILIIDQIKEVVSGIQEINKPATYSDLDRYAKEQFPYSDSIKISYINKNNEFKELTKYNYYNHCNEQITIQGVTFNPKFKCIVITSKDPIITSYSFYFNAIDPKERLTEIFEDENLELFYLLDNSLASASKITDTTIDTFYLFIPGFVLKPRLV